ncbi:MAG: FtsX-like permease family protein [Bacteroidota bacterium]
MTAIMAWRNIWRNPTRSGVVIVAIALGIWAAIFMTGFATGMMNSYINGAISTVVGHIQIHHPDFNKDQEVKFQLDQPNAIANYINGFEQVEAYSMRTLVNGMVASSNGTRGIQIQGIDAEAENVVRQLEKKVIDGTYFTDGKRNPILVSQKLAEKLKLKIRSKVVLTFQDVEGEIVSAAFRVQGIFDTKNNLFDESKIFVKRVDLNRLLNFPESAAHEIGVILKDNKDVKLLKPQWDAHFKTAVAEPYYEVSPDLELYESQMSTVSQIYLTIILLALIFGIINTMLMSILERFRELGMLMAIGMNKLKVFGMIVMETFLLSFAGVPLGLLLGWLTITYFGTRGMNLSAFSESLQMYGMSDFIYFQVDAATYYNVPLMVAITAIIASIYPALKAIRLKPVEAIRKI